MNKLVVLTGRAALTTCFELSTILLREGLSNVPTRLPAAEENYPIVKNKLIYALRLQRFELSTQCSFRLHEGVGDLPTCLTAAQENLLFSGQVNLCIGLSAFRTLDSIQPPTG